jgi:hypothetical protein
MAGVALSGLMALGSSRLEPRCLGLMSITTDSASTIGFSSWYKSTPVYTSQIVSFSLHIETHDEGNVLDIIRGAYSRLKPPRSGHSPTTVWAKLIRPSNGNKTTKNLSWLKEN